MKRILAVFFCMSFLTCSWAQSLAPRITTKSDSFDFGQIREGQIVKHSFEIENSGTAELKISEVRTSCGCTAVKPEKMILNPGEKTNIKVEFNSENRLGPQEKYVYIFSNDPVNAQYKLSLTGVIAEKIKVISQQVNNPKIRLNKTQHDFKNVEEGKVVDVKIGFKNEGNGVLEISDVKTSCGCAAALLSSKSLKPGESGHIRIELDTANREGKLTRTVTLVTNDTLQPNQVITLFVNIIKRKQ